MKNLARSIRLLVHQPRYTLLAVLTLAAGIGAPSAIFGLLDAVYFRPLPIAEPDRLVDVTLVSPASRFAMLSYEEVRDIERSVPAFKDVMAIGQRGVTLNRNGEAELLLIHYVSGRFFPSLGIPMHLARILAGRRSAGRHHAAGRHQSPSLERASRRPVRHRRPHYPVEQHDVHGDRRDGSRVRRHGSDCADRRVGSRRRKRHSSCRDFGANWKTAVIVGSTSSRVSRTMSRWTRRARSWILWPCGGGVRILANITTRGWSPKAGATWIASRQCRAPPSSPWWVWCFSSRVPTWRT